MGNKYTIMTFHVAEGKKYFGGYDSLFSAVMDIWRLKKLKHFGCISLEIR